MDIDNMMKADAYLDSNKDRAGLLSDSKWGLHQWPREKGIYTYN